MYEKELKAAIAAAQGAGDIILEVYHRPFEVETKEDNSPVTEADKQSDAYIRKCLEGVIPKAGFLTEESHDDKKRLKKDYVWIIDPLDGTKDFVNKDDEFTVNIALAYKHEVVVGVIYHPINGLTYYAVKGEGAYRKGRDGKISLIRVNGKTDKLTVLVSRNFSNAQEAALVKKHSDKIAYKGTLGAAGKFCAIAEGSAELTYRMSPRTKEWDVAPGDLLVREAGGIVLQTDMTRFTYNRDDVYNRIGYIVTNRKENILL